MFFTYMSETLCTILLWFAQVVVLLLSGFSISDTVALKQLTKIQWNMGDYKSIFKLVIVEEYDWLYQL